MDATSKPGPNGGRAKAPSPTKAGNGDVRGCFAGHFLGPRILVVWRGLLGAWESRPLRWEFVYFASIFERVFAEVNGTWVLIELREYGECVNGSSGCRCPREKRGR